MELKPEDKSTPMKRLSMGRNDSRDRSNASVNSAAKWKSCSSESIASSHHSQWQWDAHDKQAFSIVRKKNRLEAQNDAGFILDDNNEIAHKMGLSFKKFGHNHNPPDKKTIDRMLKNVGQKMKYGAYTGKAQKKIKKRKLLVNQSSGSIHNLVNSNPNSFIVNSDNDQKFIQENARAAL